VSKQDVQVTWLAHDPVEHVVLQVLAAEHMLAQKETPAVVVCHTHFPPVVLAVLVQAEHDSWALHVDATEHTPVLLHASPAAQVSPQNWNPVGEVCQ